LFASGAASVGGQAGTITSIVSISPADPSRCTLAVLLQPMAIAMSNAAAHSTPRLFRPFINDKVVGHLTARPRASKA
jgi:hypothetical protein